MSAVRPKESAHTDQAIQEAVRLLTCLFYSQSLPYLLRRSNDRRPMLSVHS